MFQKYMVIFGMAETEKIIMQLRLGLRSQCFTYVLYKHLHISFLYVPSYTTIYIKITQLRVTV